MNVNFIALEGIQNTAPQKPKAVQVLALERECHNFGALYEETVVDSGQSWKFSCCQVLIHP